MKHSAFFSIVLLTVLLLLSGCGKPKESKNYTCSIPSEVKNVVTSIEYKAEDGEVVSIRYIYKEDITGSGKSALERVKELQNEALFYKIKVTGVEYNFISEGSVITETVDIDVKSVIYTRLVQMDKVITVKQIEGDEKNYRVLEEVYREYLEAEEGKNGSCSLKD